MLPSARQIWMISSSAPRVAASASSPSTLAASPPVSDSAMRSIWASNTASVSASALRQVIATCTSAVASTASSSSAVRRARSEGVAGSVRAIRRMCRPKVDKR